MNATQKIEAAGPHVYRAIAAVMNDMAAVGISKSNKNAQQGYKFRGIDDVYNALSSVLAKHHLCMLPRVIARECVERQTRSGGTLFYTTVEAEFDLVSAIDGSIHVIRTVGEAMDSADKSSNKAMSAAYKYAAMQAFCIPTEGDNDADATTHEVVAAMITADQQSLITTIANAVGKAVPDIYRAYGVEGLDALTAKQAEAVIKRLQSMAPKQEEVA
jgi:hypothetical protein